MLWLKYFSCRSLNFHTLNFSFCCCCTHPIIFRLCLLPLSIVARDLNPLPCIMLSMFIFYCVSCVLILLFPEDLTSTKKTEHLNISFDNIAQQSLTILLYRLGVHRSCYSNVWSHPSNGRLCLQHNTITYTFLN